jgi:hypothetical protein
MNGVSIQVNCLRQKITIGVGVVCELTPQVGLTRWPIAGTLPRHFQQETFVNFRRLALSVSTLALGLLTSVAALAGPDEDAVVRQVETFRNAQFTANAATLNALAAPELSYSHSDGRVEDRATFVANATAGKSTFVSLEYRNPSIRVVGSNAVVRFNWVGEQQSVATGARTPTNLHILMVWHKQGDEWKLLARSATKL